MPLPHPRPCHMITHVASPVLSYSQIYHHLISVPFEPSLSPLVTSPPLTKPSSCYLLAPIACLLLLPLLYHLPTCASIPPFLPHQLPVLITFLPLSLPSLFPPHSYLFFSSDTSPFYDISSVTPPHPAIPVPLSLSSPCLIFCSDVEDVDSDVASSWPVSRCYRIPATVTSLHRTSFCSYHLLSAHYLVPSGATNYISRFPLFLHNHLTHISLTHTLPALVTIPSLSLRDHFLAISTHCSLTGMCHSLLPTLPCRLLSVDIVPPSCFSSPLRPTASFRHRLPAALSRLDPLRAVKGTQGFHFMGHISVCGSLKIAAKNLRSN